MPAEGFPLRARLRFVLRPLQEPAHLFQEDPQPGEAVFYPAHHTGKDRDIHGQKQGPQSQEKPTLQDWQKQTGQAQENEEYP